MRTLLASITLLATSACMPTVRMEVAPSPAYALQQSTVAVVAGDRSCREVADGLVAQINGLPGMEVDPRSETRLSVQSCGEWYRWDLMQEVDDSGDKTRRRATLHGRAHAVVSVTHFGAHQAHLIGSGHHADPGGWRDSPLRDTLQRTRATQRDLVAAVAADLATQLSPVPQLVQRRFYPNALQGTARDLHNLAVEAEISGDLDEAWRLAKAAHTERPSSRSSEYIIELERRRTLLNPTD